MFVSDGQAWNWSIWEENFPDYEQVLDFIHVTQYLYAAAEAAEQTGTARWQRYLKMAEAVWQNRVDEVISELKDLLAARTSEAALGCADDVSSQACTQPLTDAVR